MLILDTCALIFWTMDQEALSPTASRVITEAVGMGVSSISIWEIGIKIKRGKLALPMTLSDYVDRLKLLDRLEILPVDERIWIKNIELDWPHNDPADRTIVATASIQASPLVTSDKRILDFYPEAIW